MPGGATLSHKIYFANGAHPGLYGPMHLCLVMNVILWIHKCFGTARERAVFQLKKKSSYFVARVGTGAMHMSWTTLPPYQLPTA